MNNQTILKRILSMSLMAGLLGACATSSDVDRKIAEAQSQQDKKIEKVDKKFESVEGQIEDIQQKQKATDAKIDSLSQEAKEALKRAQEAGVLAKGKVVFSQTFT
ncbi:MAG TPA: hypothetical protein VEZ11_09945, partial [Thermoanaerobaculia bacterium]|nr:hypothetical protein [Thermoanaerobaculia bacterium]